MGCIDGQSVKKAEVVMHHAVSDLMVDWDDAKVSKWFSDTGKSRGYAGIDHSYHCDPYTGKESFSQAHYCLHPYTKDNNKYGWRLTLLIQEPFQNVCWHASNWTVNQRSLGIETAGVYTDKKLDEKALMLVADTFRDYDKEIGGKLNITGHRDYVDTACPGKIHGQLPDLIDMFNNPDKWNKKLFGEDPIDPVDPPDTCKAEREQIEALQAQLEVSEKDIEAKGSTIAIMTKKAEDWKAKYDIALAKLKKMEDDDIKEHKELETLSGKFKAIMRIMQGQ